MPKQPGGISKAERMDSLRRILKRWGRLNKPQIDQHVSEGIRCDPEEIARSLYRDLNELVERHEVRAVYYTRDGAEIPEFDPDLHKNTYCEWAWVESETQVVGGAFLKDLGVILEIAPALKNAVSVMSLQAAPHPDALNAYFYFNRSGFLFRVMHQDLPISLRAGRKTESVAIGDRRPAEERRSARLYLPIPGFSSFKDPIHPGHFSLSAENASLVRLTDLNSKNGTSCGEMAKKSAYEVWERESRMQEATASVNQRSGPTGIFQGETAITSPIVPGSAVHLELPALVAVSSSFRLLMI